MNSRCKTVLVSLSIFLIILTLWIAFRRSAQQLVELPDGTRLTIMGASYGTNSFYDETMPQRFARKWVPLSFHNSMGLTRGQPFTLPEANQGDLIIWLKKCPPVESSSHSLGPWNPSETRVVAYQANVCEFENPGPRPVRKEGSCAVEALRLTAYPRQADAISLRLMNEAEPNSWKTYAEFTIKNPNRVESADWDSQSLPLTNVIENLSVVFHDVTIARGRAKTYPFASNAMLFFKFSSAPSSSTWSYKKCVIRDGSGNYQAFFMPIQTNGLVAFTSVHTLNPKDVWKVELDLIHDKGRAQFGFPASYGIRQAPSIDLFPRKPATQEAVQYRLSYYIEPSLGESQASSKPVQAQ